MAGQFFNDSSDHLFFCLKVFAQQYSLEFITFLMSKYWICFIATEP